MKKIADISHYQGNINWAEARKELSLVIFRASVGMKRDQKYLENASACGIPYGVYHYVKAGTAAEAEQEARFFVESANRTASRSFILQILNTRHRRQPQPKRFASRSWKRCESSAVRRLACISIPATRGQAWPSTCATSCGFPIGGKTTAKYLPRNICPSTPAICGSTPARGALQA